MFVCGSSWCFCFVLFSFVVLFSFFSFFFSWFLTSYFSFLFWGEISGIKEYLLDATLLAEEGTQCFLKHNRNKRDSSLFSMFHSDFQVAEMTW